MPYPLIPPRPDRQSEDLVMLECACGQKFQDRRMLARLQARVECGACRSKRFAKVDAPLVDADVLDTRR